MVYTTSFLNSGVYRLFGTPFGIKITPLVRHYITLSNKWGAVQFPVSGIFYFVQSVTDTIFISTSTIFGNASTGIAS